MNQYTIDNFWRKRLAIQATNSQPQLKGWQANVPALATFKEAPLVKSDSITDADPEDSPLIIVSAPGAVGKTTLARQIASQTGALYVDLAASEPVGSNTLSGGLVKSGMFQAWQTGATAVLIDGLDEARLKVTQEAFESFLNDVAELSLNRILPTVLFGRSGAAQDAWILLTDKVPVSVLEIGYYGPADAVDFAGMLLATALPNNPHFNIGRKALKLLLEKLRDDTEGDGDRFAGYAPVIHAVADRVARDTNPSALVAQIEKGERPVTLQTVVEAILDREHYKLNSLSFDDPKLSASLYLPKEQLERLAARAYGGPPPSLPPMSANDAQIYLHALETWVPEHPFLDGSVNPASTVFGAVIAATALRNKATSDTALTRELAKGSAANPFLSEIYLSSGGVLPPEHIGVVYSSLRARLSLGDTASLLIEGSEEGEDEEKLRSEVEMVVTRSSDDRPKILQFESEQTGVIRLGSHIEDVEVNAPYAKVEVGGAQESVLIAPISIQCAEISFSTDRLILESQPSREESGIYIEAEAASASSIRGVPILNGGVALAVAWPGSNAYPWNSFSTSPTKIDDPRLNEALRRFRKFIISFRSHSKGSLKRLGAKIEHERMTKGAGKQVLNHLLTNGILTGDGKMYQLHVDQLTAKTGASYLMCMSRNFPQTAVQFVAEAIIKDK